MSILAQLVGQVLDDKYQIEKQLGQGGMGAVYRATHLGTKRPVALKVITPQFMANAEFVERFKREAEAAGRLHHPNVVNVTDFGFAQFNSAQLAYLVMEYLDGCALGDLLDKRGPLPLGFVVDIVEQVALAVDKAHQQGIIHRDLKPDNIWLEPNGRGGYTVKVLDFGLAKLHEPQDRKNDPLNPPLAAAPLASTKKVVEANRQLSLVTAIQSGVDPEAATNLQLNNLSNNLSNDLSNDLSNNFSEAATNPHIGDLQEAATGVMQPRETQNNPLQTVPNAGLTQAGAVLGTPLYMSPEQCSGTQLDGRTDIYSLGVIVYQMLSGATPFSGPVNSLIINHIITPPPPLKEKQLKISKTVANLVMSALAKDPDSRPATATAFATGLRINAEGEIPLINQGTDLHRRLKGTYVKISAMLYAPAILFIVLLVALLALTESSPNQYVHWLHKSFWLFWLLFICFIREFNNAAYMLVTERLRVAPLSPITPRQILSQLRPHLWPLTTTILLGYGTILLRLGKLIVPGLRAGVDFLLMSPVVVMEQISGQAALARSKTLTDRLRPVAIPIAMRGFFWNIVGSLLWPLFLLGIAGLSFDLFYAVVFNLTLPLIALGYAIFSLVMTSRTVVATSILYHKALEANGDQLAEADSQPFATLEPPGRATATYTRTILLALFLVGAFSFIGYSYRDPLCEAAADGDVKAVKMLLNSGANVNHRSASGETALMYAARSNYGEIIEILKVAGADANIRNRQGETALMYAVTRGRKKNAQLLIAAGADVNVKSNAGKTALSIAIDDDYDEIITLLKAAGAK